MSKCIERRNTKDFFIITDTNYKKAFEWLFDIYGKKLNILDHYINNNGLVYIKYRYNNQKKGLYLPLGNVALYDKENKSIFTKDLKNFLKEFCILT